MIPERLNAGDDALDEAKALSLRRGAIVRVRGRRAVFVKCWGTLGAVIRFDDRPQEPKVVPMARIELA